MSGVGFFELVILFMIGLVVLGPQRLPKVANQLGTWIGQARRMTRVMKRQLEDELDLGDDFKSLKSIGDDLKNELKDDLTIGPEAAHVPRDDDSYSPLHDKNPKPAVAGIRVDENAETTERETKSVDEVRAEPAEPETMPDGEESAADPAKEKPA
jgi:sec-independent protein translocase protein TatB